MDTFTSLYQRVAEFCGIDSTNIPITRLAYFKRDLNRGIAKIFTTVRVGYTQHTLTSNLVSGQQYYQIPPDCIRPTTVQVLASGVTAQLPLQEVQTIAHWNEINVWPQISFPYPQEYFVRGHTQIGLWPTPGGDVENGLIVTYEATPPELAIDDITSTNNVYSNANREAAVTATVTNGSTSVTFSQNIINVPNNNLWFMTTDGTDGHAYAIVEITGENTVILGQAFQLPGNTSATAQFRIGQMVDIPDMVQMGGVYYAAAQFYTERKDAETSEYYMVQYQQCIGDFRSAFSTRSSSRTASNDGTVSGLNAWDMMGINPVNPGY